MNRKAIINEFVRCIFVGEAVFCIDILTLYFFKTQIFFGLGFWAFMGLPYYGSWQD